MIVYLVFLIVTVGIPFVENLYTGNRDEIMTIFTWCVGMIILLSVVGIKVSEHLGSTLLRGIFRAISFVVVTIVGAIAWILRNTLRMAPRCYRELDRFFRSINTAPGLSMFLSATLTTVLVLIII